MYLKRVTVQNVGPISNLDVALPFDDTAPLPLVLVGPNGSGKTTLLSFIVNGLVAFKQQAFENAEVDRGAVYRARSTRYLRGGAHWYHVKLEFEEGLMVEEWVLDRPKNLFENTVTPLPTNDGWKQISDEGTNQVVLTPSVQHFPNRVLSKPIQTLFGKNVVLFFPSDRFELPDWLNERALASELRFPEAVIFEGETARRIFSRALLKPTLEWFKAVVFDSLLPGGDHERENRIVGFMGKVLARIVEADSDHVQFRFSQRNMGIIAAEFTRAGTRQHIPNLLGLSAGQAALFCIFSNLLRDYDLSGAPFTDFSEVRGIVVLDEADLHLHVHLQYQVFPELMKLFPKVQFILTAHSPLFVMGMEKTFGKEGLRVIELPSGEQIEPEAFSEFGSALTAFTTTQAFKAQVLDAIQRADKPVIIVEGKSDRTHLQGAWDRLHPGQPLPWDVVPCGGPLAKDGRGGADMLRTILRASCCNHPKRVTLGLFDHDREGVEQFDSLRKADGFQAATSATHLKHPTESVHALLLPVPFGREKFSSERAKSCHLALEHYYSDELLKRYGVADDPVVSDSVVFDITTDSRKKNRLLEALPTLDRAEFANFAQLFDCLHGVLGTQSPPSAPLMSSVPELCSAGFSFSISTPFAVSFQSHDPIVEPQQPLSDETSNESGSAIDDE